MAATIDQFDRLHVNKTGIGSLAGSSGYGGVSLNGDFHVYICIMTNGDTYMGLSGGSITWSGSGLVHGNSWPLYFAGGTHAFSGKTADLGSKIEFKMKVANDVSSSSSTSLKYDLPSVGTPVKGHSLPSGTWNKTKPASSWVKNNTPGTQRKYYLAFPAHNNGGDVNTVTFNSVEIIFESEIFNPFYFPGKVKQSNGEWWSCNRTNYGSNRSTGYFRKKKGGAWKPYKNKQNSSDESLVFLHNGSGWNTIAPKIGKE